MLSNLELPIVVPENIRKVVLDIVAERKRQDEKWGEQNHDPIIYSAILTEEVGELSQAALETKFGGKHGGDVNLRKEAIHCAAVAMAIVECLDRGKWKKGNNRAKSE